MKIRLSIPLLAFSLAFPCVVTTQSSEGQLHKLTNIESSYPFWSPDGRQIVFQSNRIDGNREIYIMNADGTGLRRLTFAPGDDQTPVWSPDGAWIAFQSHRDGNPEIYIMRPDGSGQANLTNDPVEDSHPKWSPDGRWIIFDCPVEGDNDEIWEMNIDGSELHRITDDPSRDTYASIAPDGSRIVWRRRLRDPEAERGFGNSEVFVMNRDGSDPVNLTDHPAYDGWPAWSPDGGRILCTRTKDGNVEIFIVELPLG